MIQRLASDVISELRSGVALTCLSQCVDELVFNSIDAGSTSIIVDVSIPTVSLEVSDNGTGVSQSDLKNIGQRYFTSKCHNLDDLENAASYGYRGEALASLAKICQKLEVISRHKTSCRTFCKLVRKGKDMGVHENTSPRPRHGTTVKAYGVFYALPVRQKLISEKVDLELIRRHVLAVALMNPGLLFLVRNKETGCILFQTQACSSTLSVISQVFGCDKSRAFKPVSQAKDMYTVTGYVNLEGSPNRNFQFFYVNKRLVLKTKFHNVANHVLARGISGLIRSDLESGVEDEGLCCPKKLDKYCGFVINLQCPYDAYDITLDPEKTLVEFQNWEAPISCLKECLNGFLKQEGLFKEEFCESECGLESDSVKPDSENGVENPNTIKKSIKASDLRRSLYSSTAKRKQKNISECSRGLVSSSGVVGLEDMYNSSCVESEKNGEGKGRTHEMVLNGSVEDCSFGNEVLSTSSGKEDISPCRNSSVCSMEPFSEQRTMLDQSEPRSGKRSILARLQKYNCTQDEASPPARSCEQPSGKNERNINIESKTSHGSKRRCLGLRWSKELDERSDTSFIRRTITAEIQQSHESRTSDLNYAREQSHLTLNYVQTHSLESTTKSCKDDDKKLSNEWDGYEWNEKVREKNCPIQEKLYGKPNSVCNLENLDKNIRVEERMKKNSECRGETIDGLRDLKRIDVSGIKGSPTDNMKTSQESRIVDSLTTDYNSAGSIEYGSSTTSTFNSRMVKATTSASINDEPPMKESKWLFQYNPQDGRPVYVNLRTGNTSIVEPNCKPEPTVPVLEKPTDSSKMRHFHPFASHLSHNFTPWLPRSASCESESRISRDSEVQSNEIGEMLDKWINPVFEGTGKPIADACFSNDNRTSTKLHSSAQPFRFTKDCFNKMKVVSQVDDKFILCHYKGDGDSVLVVVDQHAAHERVRLETFTKDLYINSARTTNKMVMKSSPLHSAQCKLSMSEHDIYLMQTFRAPLQRVGIRFEDSRSSSSDVQSSVCIKTVPSVFLAREYSKGGEELRTEIKSCIEAMIKFERTMEEKRVCRSLQELIKEQIEAMLSTKGTQTTTIPKAIIRVLNSQACHGAIRFGDSLSTEECVNLMTSLSKCDLPFQCAHGRPSMIPLIDTKLTQIGISKKVTSLPKIWRIKQQVKGKLKN